MFTFHFRLSSNGDRTEDENKRLITWGEIYIGTENGYFPCIGWSDRILSAISMWRGNAMRMVDPEYGEQQVTNYFMDGPYFFDLQKIPEDRLLVRFMKSVGDTEQEELPLLSMPLTDYCHALLELSENIINDPHFQGYGPDQERMNFQRGASRFKALLSPEN